MDAVTEWVNALKTVAHRSGWPDSYTLGKMNKFITSFEMIFTSQELSITETWKKNG